MIYLVYTIHVLVSLFLILVVLLQQGKGADLSVFSGGSTQAAFGVRGATTLLHKLTVASFVIFILTTMTIAIMQTQRSGGSSVMKSVAEQERNDITHGTKNVAEEEPAEGQTPAAAETPAAKTPSSSEKPAPSQPEGSSGSGDGGGSAPQNP